jgi:hypothetical protein
LNIEAQEPGTVHLILRFQTEKFQSNVMRHTKSSAALITTKKGSDTNFRAKYMSKLDRLEDDEINRKLFMDKIEII